LNIELKNISLKFDSRVIAEKMCWMFYAGKFYLLKGPSGCGKSSLLRLISGLTDADGGSVEVSQELGILEQRRSIHYLTQMPIMFPGTVEENLLKPFSFAPYIDRAPAREEYESLLSELFPEGLDLTQNAEKLSQGQKQRVALCRTLLIKPEVLLCDEPAASLDIKSRQIVDQAIERFFQSSKDKMVIYVSHHEDIFVDGDCEKILMKEGKLELVS
jgi:ABC-type transport system involved in cytochrome bd biosynthesis fused ATPase/permease subunit